MKKEKISQYICAKDSNKPHLMKSVFSENSKLNIKLNTENISFPSETLGVEEITRVLVKDFNKTYENVYTFCLEDTVIESKNTLECKWLVFMSEKDTNTIRVGYGTYFWNFEENEMVSSLFIDIENMTLLEEQKCKKIFSYISKVSYPWCNKSEVMDNIYSINQLSYLKEIID